MSKQKPYSTAKSQFVQNKMNEGRTNKQAHKDWKKSDERKQYNEWDKYSDHNVDTDPIDRNPNSIMQDWAETEDDY